MRTTMRVIECNGEAYEATREDGKTIKLYSIGRCNVLVLPNDYHVEVRGSQETLERDFAKYRREFALGIIN